MQARKQRVALTRVVTGSIMLGLGLSACGGESERAVQSARIAALEQEVRRLNDNVAELKAAPVAAKPAEPAPASPAIRPFKIQCPQPWLLHTPLGETLWNCRAPQPTPQGLYPQCHVTLQPQVAIETKEYFEFALNAAPQLLEVKNLKDKPTKINGADAFEATFDADPKTVPLRITSALLPHGTSTYAVTCFAPSAVFDAQAKAFAQIIGTFSFPDHNAAANP